MSALSRTAPSETMPAAPVAASLDRKMPPPNAACVSPRQSATKTCPAGQLSNACACSRSRPSKALSTSRSSRAGILRTVKASPAITPDACLSAFTPRMATFLNPCLNSIVATVALLLLRSLTSVSFGKSTIAFSPVAAVAVISRSENITSMPNPSAFAHNIDKGRPRSTCWMFARTTYSPVLYPRRHAPALSPGGGTRSFGMRAAML